MGENRRFEVPRPIDYQLKEETIYLNSANVVGRESDIQTQRFNYNFSNGAPVAVDTFELDRPIILTKVSIGLVANGAYTIGINDVTDSIGAGNSGAVPQNLELSFPNWRIEAGEVLCSNALNCGIVWIGYYAD